jgi:hypothetical protein
MSPWESASSSGSCPELSRPTHAYRKVTRKRRNRYGVGRMQLSFGVLQSGLSFRIVRGALGVEGTCARAFITTALAGELVPQAHRSLPSLWAVKARVGFLGPYGMAYSQKRLKVVLPD